eukprot:TRINITY_DN10540_c0_g1_i1.p1 TRINITY_DN10540_c0_g1~~TRINITY_DN10540_c0_g1_i1.p1  ORF type:complete len:185 (-),score=43.91 TRINITY_DN10540_c0_g1_i1:13-567(-)
MGNSMGGLTPEEVEQIRKEGIFTEKELQRIYRRFQKLDSDNSGTISTQEFVNIPELALNPLLERVINIFDSNRDGEIQFSEFISGLSVFATKGDPKEKLRFAFNIYDINGDGYISNGELFKVLKMMVGNNLNDVQLQQIVDKTVVQADKDKDGKISFEEFVEMVSNVDEIEDRLSFSFDDRQNE